MKFEGEWNCLMILFIVGI